MAKVILHDDVLVERLYEVYPGIKEKGGEIKRLQRPDRQQNKLLFTYDGFGYEFHYDNKWNWSMDVRNDYGKIVAKIINGECTYVVPTYDLRDPV